MIQRPGQPIACNRVAVTGPLAFPAVSGAVQMTVQRFAALAFRTGNMLQNAAIAAAIPGTGTQQRLQMLLQMAELDNLNGCCKSARICTPLKT